MRDGDRNGAPDTCSSGVAGIDGPSGQAARQSLGHCFAQRLLDESPTLEDGAGNYNVGDAQGEYHVADADSQIRSHALKGPLRPYFSAFGAANNLGERRYPSIPDLLPSPGVKSADARRRGVALPAAAITARAEFPACGDSHVAEVASQPLGVAAAVYLASKDQSDSDACSNANDNEIASRSAGSNTQAAAAFVHGCSRGVGFDDDWNAVADPLRVLKAKEVGDCKVSPSQMRRVE